MDFNIKNQQYLDNFLKLKVSEEFSHLSEDCYYPRMSNYHLDLLKMIGIDDKQLIQKSKELFKNPKFKILHYPKNTLPIFLMIKYLQENNLHMALIVNHYLTLRFYSISMKKFIPYCKKEFFKVAYSKLSSNHLFKVHDTISGSLLYLSNTLFKKYSDGIKKIDKDIILKYVYELRHRIAQSARSFAKLFHEALKNKEAISSKEQEFFDPTKEIKVKILADKLGKEITLYKKFDENILKDVIYLTKFNKKLAYDYARALHNIKYTDNLILALTLFLQEITKRNITINKENLINLTRQLMSIKYTTQNIYFKAIIIAIHDNIIKDLFLEDWFNKLSVQSKGLSRRFLAYYIILLSFKEYI